MSESAIKSAPKLQPRIVKPGEGEGIKPFGLTMQVMLSTEDTGGAFSAIYAEHAPGKGPMKHMHHHQDEYAFIIEGTYEVVVNDGAPQHCGPGTLIFVPRGNTHSFKNIGTETARLLDWSLPGGQDKYFREVDSRQKSGDGFTGNDVAEVNARYDTHYFTP